jgi:hypothetical protein
MMCYKLRFAIFYGVMWDCGLPHFMGHRGTCGSGRVGFIQEKVEAYAYAYIVSGYQNYQNGCCKLSADRRWKGGRVCCKSFDVCEGEGTVLCVHAKV